MDAANVDLKAFTDRFYRTWCAGSLEPVLDTLRHVRHETACWLEITTLLIPGENDSEEEVGALARWVARELGRDVPVHFTAFHPAWRMRDRGATPARTVIRAREVARACGLEFVYTGNVHDPEGQTTSCPGCGATLVARDGYEILAWGLGEDARCRACGAACPGTFAARAGTWGPRRRPVRLSGPGGRRP
jgi:pyruvate formate lyase activating enzyme